MKRTITKGYSSVEGGKLVTAGLRGEALRREKEREPERMKRKSNCAEGGKTPIMHKRGECGAAVRGEITGKREDR